MRILLTGGSGDLGSILSRRLTEQGDSVLRLDIRPPKDSYGTHVTGSILDRPLLTDVMDRVDCVVHIAAWHGIHEFRQQKDAYDFWDVNVTGTFNVLEATARANISRLIFISSTSVDEPQTNYGQSKILGEAIAASYSQRYPLSVLTLRPRAFIPYWNTDAYSNFVEWAHWFWGGAVHIRDVAQGVMKGIDLLRSTRLEQHLVLTLDGAYEFTDDDLQDWDSDGEGATFLRRYSQQDYDLAVHYGLNPARKPEKWDISETRRWLNYAPTYSLRNLLNELAQYGLAGPPPE